MMNQIENTKENKEVEKLCSFYASDYHFEMISIPYIEKEIKNKNQIIILTENNLEETVQKVLASTHLEEEEKQKTVRQTGTGEMGEKIKEDKTPTTVFIKGSKNYIQKMDKQIEENTSKITKIHCYEVQEVAHEMPNIVKQYGAILNTIGKIDM